MEAVVTVAAGEVVGAKAEIGILGRGKAVEGAREEARAAKEAVSSSATGAGGLVTNRMCALRLRIRERGRSRRACHHYHL
jgi:hypothetical protein